MQQHIKTLILVFLLLLPCTVKGLGYYAFLLSPFFTVALCVHVYKILKRPNERRRRAVSIAIIVIGFMIVGIVHSYYYYSSKSIAEKLIVKIEEYIQHNGTYPHDIKLLGQRQDQHGVQYFYSEGRPVLIRRGTLYPYSKHHYDFQTRRWGFRSE